MTDLNILNIEMQENDAGAKTIGEYLGKLLCRVVIETEGFSGKRPFGNSGWYRELYFPLISAGVVEGKIVDDDGYKYAEGYDANECDRILCAAIRGVFA